MLASLLFASGSRGTIASVSEVGEFTGRTAAQILPFPSEEQHRAFRGAQLGE